LRATCPDLCAFLSATLPSTYAEVTLNHYSDGGGTFEDDARFLFLKFSVPAAYQPFTLSWVDTPGLGTCAVYNSLKQSNGNGPITLISQLDAGPTFTVSGPKGTVNLPVGSGGNTEFNNTGTFLVPGNYTVTGTGGADVGPSAAPSPSRRRPR
jgi:hypothetical protein